MITFNDVEPLQMAILGANKASEAPDCVIIHQGDGMLVLNPLEARALRDWLSLALPLTEETPEKRCCCGEWKLEGNTILLETATSFHRADGPCYQKDAQKVHGKDCDCGLCRHAHDL